MVKRIGSILCATLVALALSGCASSQPPAEREAETELVACQEPRPELCTQQYLPVCGQRDTGIRCVTTPCPSQELKNYGNACVACSDPAVIGWRPGECP